MQREREKSSKSRRKQKQIGLVSTGPPSENWRLVSRVFLFFKKNTTADLSFIKKVNKVTP
jgi:hypothetical protein